MGMSLALDSVDGYVARKAGQTSEFGAFLDVGVDILSRGLLTSSAYSSLGTILSLLESLVFTVNHRLGKEWKDIMVEGTPIHIRKVMKNGFRSPLGALSMLGLFLLPCYVLFGVHYPQVWSHMTWRLLGLFLALCRILCAYVEVFCLWRHIRHLINLDNMKTIEAD
eukprot:CAMPEP_0184687796 /NCGR_PEP_ID=MMETSP0312-20130426/27571_1 /TAXON_ID=31354 /ORGANISM="Compsopogon coeruleus, Strain SAG 36.94" /LENGTH=165 /DNA_ID=CAMNT_0027144293 /DNA_START=418 /DNA_END=912 /DNA_ORIENTATION=+